MLDTEEDRLEISTEKRLVRWEKKIRDKKERKQQKERGYSRGRKREEKKKIHRKTRMG